MLLHLFMRAAQPAWQAEQNVIEGLLLGDTKYAFLSFMCCVSHKLPTLELSQVTGSNAGKVMNCQYKSENILKSKSQNP